MGVVSIDKAERVADRPASGSDMDRVVERRGLPRWAPWAIGGVGLILALVLFWAYGQPARGAGSRAGAREDAAAV